MGKCDGRGATLQFMIDLILYIGPISCGRVKLCVECFGIKLKISCYRGHSGLEEYQIQNENISKNYLQITILSITLMIQNEICFIFTFWFFKTTVQVYKIANEVLK